MIHEIDHVLRALMQSRLLPELSIDVEFAAPTRDWAARRNGPTVNAFLYDIREDDQRRASGRQNVRDDGGRIVARARPTRWFQLTYLLTAWTNRPEDEHRLLSALLGMLLRDDSLPDEELTPTLSQLGVSFPMRVGAPPAESRSVTELWSALGGELKPSLDLTVVTPLPDPTRFPVGPQVSEVVVEARDGAERIDAMNHHFSRDAAGPRRRRGAHGESS